MNRRSRLIMIALGVLLCQSRQIFITPLLATELSDSTDAGGQVTLVIGDVRKKTAVSNEWTLAPEQTRVVSGDRIRTLQDSRAELELRELDILRLAPRTEIDIRRLYDEVSHDHLVTDLFLEEGEVWADIESLDESTEFSFDTRVAGAAITGTEFRMKSAADGATELKVYHGEVQLTNSEHPELLVPTLVPDRPARISGPKRVSGPRRVSFEEWVVIVRDMQVVRLDSHGQITSSGQFDATDADEQSDWTRWNRERTEQYRKQK